jgi:hypothetical protein
MTVTEALHTALRVLSHEMMDLERIACRFGDWETERDLQEHTRMSEAKDVIWAMLKDLEVHG